MLSKRLFLGALAATSLSISAASAATILWDFSTGTPGDLGSPTTTQDSVPLSVPIMATGYERPLFPWDLFRKQGAGDEKGLGLAGPFVDNEISGRGFIQLDLSALTTPPLRNLDLSFSFNS